LPPQLRVDLDRRSMPYAITNLLRNAIKYARTRIRVSAQIVADQIQVHVDDDGIGILPGTSASGCSLPSPASTVRATDRPAATGLVWRSRDWSWSSIGGNAFAGDSPLGGARFTLSWPLSQNVTES
jgi:K+-sensing histidine kinase KdpD